MTVTAMFSLDTSSILKEKLQQVRKEWGIWLTLQRRKTSARGLVESEGRQRLCHRRGVGKTGKIRRIDGLQDLKSLLGRLSGPYTLHTLSSCTSEMESWLLRRQAPQMYWQIKIITAQFVQVQTAVGYLISRQPNACFEPGKTRTCNCDRG